MARFDSIQKAFEPQVMEGRSTRTAGQAILPPSRIREKTVYHRDPAAEHHRPAAHGPRLDNTLQIS
jgi:hypothetical protein